MTNNNPAGSVLGRFAPDFALPAASGPRVALGDLRNNIIVLTFWSAGCPWSRRADVFLVYRALKWEPLGVRIVGIASNFNERESEIQLEAEKRGVKFPILLDLDQTVAKAYRATNTPHFFVIDRRGTVRYTGALDDGTLQRPRPKVMYLDNTVNALLENRNPEPSFTPPLGTEIARPAEKSSGAPPSLNKPTLPPLSKPPTNPPGQPLKAPAPSSLTQPTQAGQPAKPGTKPPVG